MRDKNRARKREKTHLDLVLFDRHTQQLLLLEEVGLVLQLLAHRPEHRARERHRRRHRALDAYLTGDATHATPHKP